jgi:exodeoxyribonuclease V gamma subunit
VLHVHRCERADPLVAALGGLLAGDLADPFAREVVAVPSKGVERWLAQRLSHVLGAADGDGVCANVVFPSHLRLLDEAVAAADPSYADSVERWSAERSVWQLMEVVDRCAPSEAWCRSLAVHLGLDGSGDKGRRFAVASNLAQRFAAYGRSRPGMLRDWRAGRDEQGDGTPLPDDLTWQAELWRQLHDAIGVPSPAELLDSACADIAAGTAPVELPQRFSVFGATRISASRMQVLTALAATRDVHLWLHHASPAAWAAVQASGAAPGPRRLDASGAHVRHPLAASLSRDVRELQLLLQAAAPDLQDSHHPMPARPATLLGRLQDDLAGDRPPDTRMPIAGHDRTVQVHACHGPARQVEVVREAVLGLLAADPTLEPRDVLIMCPDVERFAPLIAASFGMADAGDVDELHPAARLRVRLADRSLRQTNPLLSLLSQLLELAANRVTATQLLDLAGTAPVRRRFGLDVDDVERLRDWTSASGTRWGLDAEHRAGYGLGGVQQGTWRSGLDRLLVGVTMEEDQEWLGDVLPLDDVDSGDIDLAGRLAEIVDRVDCAVRSMAGQHTVVEWVELLEDAVLALGDADAGEAWQVSQLQHELAAVAEAAEDTATTIGLADVTALLHARLRGRPTRANFRTGTLTVCTLVPMRSVPHRVVCLIGLDDGAFPRQGIADGDDVLARDPRTGERDIRSEDRQLLLDAICAAGDHLVITYTGADPRTGAEVPPAVPLGELLDALDLTAVAPGGGRARDHVVVRHPLQPFAARNFQPSVLGTPAPFSFDLLALAGARAAAQPRVPVPPLLAAPLPDPQAADREVALEDLVRFVQHPAKAFLRQRLGVTMSARDEDPDDALPVELGGLAKWAIGDRLLRQRLAGTPPQACIRLEQLRGELPFGPLGNAVLGEVGGQVDQLLRACADEAAVQPESLDVSVALRDGRRLSGTVPGVRGDAVLSVSYSTAAPKHRLAAWVRHLALAACHPGRDWRSVTVGRRTGGVRRYVISGVDSSLAAELLGQLVDLRDAGLREPLPMALAASAEYAARRGRGADPSDALAAARKKWAEDKFRPEVAEPEHVLVWGPAADFGLLLAPLPSRAEQAWALDDRSRFGVLARRLWAPLLAHESDVPL